MPALLTPYGTNFVRSSELVLVTRSFLLKAMVLGIIYA